MPYIEWTNELSVRSTKIDNEHKELVRLFNKLYEAMQKGEAVSIIKNVLQELETYTETHFRHEEGWLERHKYPHLKTHKQAHRAFVDKVKEVQAQYNKSPASLTLDVFNFVLDWIKNHIMVVDMRYSDYFLKMLQSR